MRLIYADGLAFHNISMNATTLRATKILVGVILVGLAIYFVLHHGIFVLGILALAGAYLIWDGARKRGKF